jgi:uncharacterized membrane protein YhaH (DUF805 family)
VRELSPVDWAVLPLKKYAVFSGRAPRAEYWWFYLGTLVVSIPLSIIDELVGKVGTISPLSSLFSLVTFIPWLAVTVRRLHDTNRSGWWLLVLTLPIMVVVAAAVAILGTSFTPGGSGAFAGASGSALIVMAVAVVAMLVAGIAMLVFMVTAGTEGPNDYGPDPYGPDGLEEVFA